MTYLVLDTLNYKQGSLSDNILKGYMDTKVKDLSLKFLDIRPLGGRKSPVFGTRVS